MEAVKITNSQIRVLNEVRDGADIFSPALARRLLDLRKKYPALVDIRSGEVVDGSKPFFRARATASGLSEIKNRKSKIKNSKEPAHE